MEQEEPFSELKRRAPEVPSFEPTAEPAAQQAAPQRYLPAGWYRNLNGPGQRYWDGQAWTDRTQALPGDERGFPVSGLATLGVAVCACVAALCAVLGALPAAVVAGVVGVVILLVSVSRAERRR
jgi:hypothetical protein